MKRKLQIGDFVRYTKKIPKYAVGQYGIVFRLLNDLRTNCQVVWFDGILQTTQYEISGAGYKVEDPGIKLVAKLPKKFAKRIEEALFFVVDREAGYYEGGKFSNLDLIEVLAKTRKLV